MRRSLPVVIALVVGIVIGAVFSPLRYTFVAATQVWGIYRCDRITGRVDLAQGINPAWQTVRPRVQDLSDKELQAQPK